MVQIVCFAVHAFLNIRINLQVFKILETKKDDAYNFKDVSQYIFFYQPTKSYMYPVQYRVKLCVSEIY